MATNLVKLVNGAGNAFTTVTPDKVKLYQAKGWKVVKAEKTPKGEKVPKGEAGEKTK